MKKTIFIVILAVCTYLLSAQAPKQWHINQWLELKANYNRQFIITTDTSACIDCMENQGVTFHPFQIVNTLYEEEGEQVLFWTIVTCPDLQENLICESLLYSSPSYQTEDGSNIDVSNLINVKIKRSEDEDLLYKMAKDNGIIVLGKNSYMPLWFTLSCTKESSGDVISVANLLYKSKLFAQIVPDILVHNLLFCSSDEFFSEQWGLNNSGQYDGIAGIDIKYCETKEITTGSSNTVVAVIDHGVELDHPDLPNMFPISYDAETFSSPSIIRGNHGTNCAGIIGAKEDNTIGVAGIAPECPIMSISSELKKSTLNLREKLANAIRFACDNNAAVLNISWGGDTLRGGPIENAIDSVCTYGREGKGCVVICAAGNFNNEVSFPASMDNVISVGAIIQNGIKKSNSNYGDSLCVVAPGVNICTTDRQGIYGENNQSGTNGNYFHYFGATSAACPHVSGVAALMLSINPNLTSQEVRDIIEQTAQKTRRDVYHYTDTIGHPNGEWNKYMGYGLVDAHRAVLKAAYNTVYGNSTLSFCDVQTFTVQNTYNGNISDVSYSWTCSENLHIISGNNTASVLVKGSGIGTGWLRCTVYHLGDTISSGKQVSVVYNSPETLYDNISISSNTTWSNTCTINGIISVDSLSILTITGTVHGTSSARLIVRPGGKLIVDGGTLTSACPNEMWQGIEVVGDRTKRQLPQYQGTVELKNGATIENALCGIRTGLFTDNDYLTTGGIISATDATFKNNRQSVVINSYAYTALSGGIANYNATFSRCTFTVDNSNLFAANGTVFAEHVRLWDVKGVKFSGCDFSNTTNNPYGNGRGIYAEDAGFTVTKKCLVDYVDPSTCSCPDNGTVFGAFSGFTTAVEVNTTGNPYAVSVDWADFENNVTGVKVKGNLFTTVTRNTFNLDEWPDAHVAGNIGLKLDSCSGYKVEENQFERTTYPSGPNLIENSIGIAVANSGISDNSLYRNHFINLTRGISVTGNNGHHRFGTGLQMTCNYFNGNKYDVYLASGATVCYHQGTSTKGADNEFHNTSKTLNNFYNPGLFNVNYYFYNGDASLHPALYTGLNLTTISSANSCASTLCNNGSQQLLAGFQSDMNAYTTAMAGNNDADGRDIAGGTGVETQNFASLQQGGTESLSETAQSLSDTYYTAVRALMADSLLDLGTLEQWHAAAQSLADPYSLTETRFMEGYAETFAADADDAEMANYAEFHAMKVALRNNVADDGGSVGANNYSPLQPGGHVNWYALTPAQIAQLQTIAERNTGRASVMAKGVLCFFHGICYEDDSLVDDNADNNAGTRAKRVTTDITDDAALTVYPNPTDDLLFMELRGVEIARVALYDLQGRMVTGTGAHAGAPQQGTTATMNMRNVPAGVYLLRVTDADGKEYHQKVVKR